MLRKFSIMSRLLLRSTMCGVLRSILPLVYIMCSDFFGLCKRCVVLEGFPRRFLTLEGLAFLGICLSRFRSLCANLLGFFLSTSFGGMYNAAHVGEHISLNFFVVCNRMVDDFI